MMVARLAKDWRLHIGVALLALVLSYSIGGPLALAGMALGLFATGFSVIALWMVVRMIGRAAPEGAAPRLGAMATVLAFLVKLPLFIVLGMLTQRIGGPAAPCFLMGLGLVYLGLIGWALASS